jgi:hypothetical protein
MMRRLGRLGTGAFRWRDGSDDPRWPGGGPVIRGGGERGVAGGVVGAKEKRGHGEKRAAIGAVPF